MCEMIKKLQDHSCKKVIIPEIVVVVNYEIVL